MTNIIYCKLPKVWSLEMSFLLKTVPLHSTKGTSFFQVRKVFCCCHIKMGTAIKAQWQSTRLLIKRSRVQLLTVCGLFLFFCLVRLSFTSRVSFIRFPRRCISICDGKSNNKMIASHAAWGKSGSISTDGVHRMKTQRSKMEIRWFPCNTSLWKACQYQN